MWLVAPLRVKVNSAAFHENIEIRFLGFQMTKNASGLFLWPVVSRAHACMLPKGCTKTKTQSVVAVLHVLNAQVTGDIDF